VKEERQMIRRLREFRERRLLTQTELAGKAGLTQKTISLLETGKARPRVRTIRKLALALGVRPEALVRGKGR
jgi:transcriptional regulator with XRE-family HTH domain